jgi:putative ABC transport system ATP-binding protein
MTFDTTIILKARGVRKKFGESLVIHGVDIDLKQGEILAIMGPSGSGKSTLLHCLAGIIDTDSGSIVYNERDITKLNQSDRTKLRRTDFGFIFQFGELVPELPVIDNVALPLLLRGVKKKQAYKVSREWLDIVGVSGIMQNFPHTISGGETQRVAIARAMAIDPEIIFADEPTGSLDSSNATKIMKLFVELADKYNKSIVFVTHSEDLAAYARRVVMLRDGLIVNNTYDSQS